MNSYSFTGNSIRWRSESDRARMQAIHPLHMLCCRSASVIDAAAATNETTLFADQMNVVNHGIKTSQASKQTLTHLTVEMRKSFIL